MALPKTIHVREDKPDQGEVYLLAARSVEECMDGEDGPVSIGVYKLVEIRRMAKMIARVSPKGSR